MAEKRDIRNVTLSNSREIDSTQSLRKYIEGLFQYAGEEAPYTLDFYITKNGNLKLTDRNEILSLKGIPIPAPIFNPDPYDPKKEDNYNTFLYKPRKPKTVRGDLNARTDRSPEEIKEAFQALSPELRDEYIQGSADLVISYILGEIGLRYIQAKNENDSATMQQLSSLKFLKEEGFSLKYFNAVMKTPGGLKTKDGKSYLIFNDNGLDINLELNETQIAKYKQHQKFRDHCLNNGRYFAHKFSGDLERYADMDIKYEQYFPTQMGE